MTNMTAQDYNIRGVEKDTKYFKNLIKFCTKVIKQKPRDAESYLLRGFAKSQIQNYGDNSAIDDLTQAIKLNSTDAVPYFWRGREHGKKKNYDAAIKDFDTAIEKKSDEKEFYNWRGFAKHHNNDYKGAIYDYDIAIKLNPNYAEAYCNRGRAKGMLQDYIPAIDDFNKAIKLKPNYAEAYNYLSFTNFQNRNYKDAINNCDKAIELNPKYADAYFNRARAKNEDENQDINDVIHDYTQAITFNPKYADAYFNRGNIYLKKKNYNDAIIHYNKVIKLNPKNANAYLGRGEAKDGQQDYDGAITDYKKSFSLLNAPIFNQQIFYRFRSMNNKYTLKTLITDRFFVANPETFNDPFDALLLRQYRNKDKLQQGLYEFDQNIRIACVAHKDSQDNCPLQNILLWSYYAENHTGIALGYRFNQEKFDKQKAFLKKVDYRQEFFKNNFENIFEEAYLTKYQNWQHEQEWRFIYLKDKNEQDPILLNYDEWGITLNEIVFGLKTTDNHKNMIKQLFEKKEHKPDFYQMKKIENNLFDLEKVVD